MQKQILQEIKELKIAIAKVIGTSELLPQEQFSEEALNKTAKEFQKLSIERGEWVDDYNIKKYIKSAPYVGAGAFIKQEFGFKNYFKRGRTFYYNKKDLISLGNELKERNVDLSRYMELKADQAKFLKYVTSANDSRNSKNKTKKKNYSLSDDLKDITTSPMKKPSAEIILEDLKNLREEFLKYNLSDYVDIYKNTYAMTKFIYVFEKYINPEIKKRSRKWCENFNYANNALKEVTGKKETFIPIKEEDMIEL